MSGSNLHNLLGRFRGMERPNETMRLAICRAVRESTGIELTVSAVHLKNGVAVIRTSAAAQSTIFLHRQQIVVRVFEDTNVSLREIRAA